MERLVLFDGHALLHRAYHALPPLTTSDGKQIHAVYGFLSMILRLIYELAPTHVLVAFDRPAPTFRKLLFPSYQQKRPKADDAFYPQVAVAHEMLKAMGVSLYEKDGFEADDVIGTICLEAIQDKTYSIDDVIIVTGDRDLLQLVDAKTKVYLLKGMSSAVLYGEKEVEKFLGITPTQVVDYKALVGDASDNYPGVAGIGPKTAVNLLHTFHTLANIYDHLTEMKNARVQTLLEKKKDDAFLSQKLATIVRDVPLSFSLSTCVVPDLNREDLYLLFDQYQFRSLIPRLSAIGKKQKIGSREKAIGEKKQEKPISEQPTLF